MVSHPTSALTCAFQQRESDENVIHTAHEGDRSKSTIPFRQENCGHEGDAINMNLAGAVSPADLWNESRRDFMCPECDQVLLLGWTTLKLKNSPTAFGKCEKCRKSLRFRLPKLDKKLIYLDQSVWSNLFEVREARLDSKSQDWRVRLLSKLHQIKRLHKGHLCLSEYHVLETAARELEEKRKAHFAFVNTLADGVIYGDLGDTFEADLYRLLSEQPNDRTKEYERGGWTIGTHVTMSNSYRLRSAEKWAEYKKTSATEISKQILSLQAQTFNGIGNVYVNDTILHVQKIYLEDIVNGLEEARNYAEALCALHDQLNKYEFDDAQSIPIDWPNFPKNVYGKIATHMTFGSNDKLERYCALNGLLKTVKKSGLNAFPVIKILAALQGGVLFRWIKADQKTAESKFNVNFGTSKQMDNLHIAVNLPVVDCLTVDGDTLKSLRTPEIASLIEQHRCKVFSASERENGFEEWLDALIAEPETNEVKCARRLLVGLSDVEYSEEVLKPLIHEALAAFIAQNSMTAQV